MRQESLGQDLGDLRTCLELEQSCTKDCNEMTIEVYARISLVQADYNIAERPCVFKNPSSGRAS